jgi:hypothetical protein
MSYRLKLKLAKGIQQAICKALTVNNTCIGLSVIRFSHGLTAKHAESAV